MDASNLRSAIRTGDINAVFALISQGVNVNEPAGKSGYTPLHLATYIGHEDILQLLLESGADVNFAEDHGNTALHYAVSRLTNLRIVEYLITFGADVNARNTLGESALYMALKKPLIRRNKMLSTQDTQIIELLINSGADVNQPDDEGRRPLHVSVVLENLEIVRMLYNAGARDSIDARDDKGNTPVHLAVMNRDPWILDLFLMGAADCNIKNNEGLTPLQCEVLKDGKYDFVRVLIDAGADVNVKSGVNSRTVLHLAARQDHSELMEDLVVGGANVNAQDSQGRTPLHYLAMDDCRARSFDVLLRNGADVDVTDECGKKPMDYFAGDDAKLKVLEMIFGLRKVKKIDAVEKEELREETSQERDEDSVLKKWQNRFEQLENNQRRNEYLHNQFNYSGLTFREACPVSVTSFLLIITIFISIYNSFFILLTIMG